MQQIVYRPSMLSMVSQLKNIQSLNIRGEILLTRIPHAINRCDQLFIKRFQKINAVLSESIYLLAVSFLGDFNHVLIPKLAKMRIDITVRQAKLFRKGVTMLWLPP